MTYSTPEMVRKAFVPSSDGTLPATQTFTAADLTNCSTPSARRTDTSTR
jgi:hypothetical protein